MIRYVCLHANDGRLHFQVSKSIDILRGKQWHGKEEMRWLSMEYMEHIVLELQI